MAAKKEKVKTIKEDGLKKLEDRIISLEGLMASVVNVDKDMDEIYGWVEDLDHIIKRIRTRMGI
jgi:hypothetical protein|tara:strand:- start:170 stop:361 length:192 start_codon:yes stop_codon:yes gene_type:complete